MWAEIARLPGFCVCRKCRFGCEEWNVPSCPPRAETAVEELEKMIAK
jgi:predicted metal-binding protein